MGPVPVEPGVQQRVQAVPAEPEEHPVVQDRQPLTDGQAGQPLGQDVRAQRHLIPDDHLPEPRVGEHEVPGPRLVQDGGPDVRRRGEVLDQLGRGQQAPGPDGGPAARLGQVVQARITADKLVQLHHVTLRG